MPRATRFEVVPEPGAQAGLAWRAIARCSAAARVVDVGPIDLARDRRTLSWRWRVVQPLPPPAVDERERSGDDFAARVYAIFAFDPEQARAWERLRRRVASALYGRSLPGHALDYVWARRLAPGTSWPSPYGAPGRMIALRSGAVASGAGGAGDGEAGRHAEAPARARPQRAPGAAAWHSERVDLAADHRRWLGPLRTPLVGIGIMSDSDDGCAEAEAWFADLRLDPLDTP